MSRRYLLVASTLCATAALVAACGDAPTGGTRPLAEVRAGAVPTCLGQTATIYPGMPNESQFIQFDASINVTFIRATPGRDVIVATDGDDVVFAGSGSDIVCSLGGSDFVSGGSGNDNISLGTGIDFSEGGQGNDDLLGGAGNNFLFGRAGTDRCTGTSTSVFVACETTVITP